jgi:hypothetical protein
MGPHPKRLLQGAIYTVWSAKEDTDKTEGRGPQTLIGYFHDQRDAETASIGKGVMGWPGGVQSLDIFSIDGGKTGYPITLGEAISIMPGGFTDRREAALAKLTDEDRRILGLPMDLVAQAPLSH